MTIVWEVTDKTLRRIYLTDERYSHLMKHRDLQNKLELVKNTLEKPLKIIPQEDNVNWYYGYDKERKWKEKYLRVIVKYLNGKGFIITAYFVEHPR